MSRKRLLACASAAALGFAGLAHAAEPPPRRLTPPPRGQATADAAQAQATARRLPPRPTLRSSIDETGLRAPLNTAYQPIGMRAGGFIVYPSARAQVAYDSNIYASKTNPKGDILFIFHPIVRVLSNWSQHALDFTVEAISNLHGSYGSENTFDYALAVDARADVVRGTSIAPRVAYTRRTEQRGSASDPGNAAEPTRYTVFDAGIAFEQRLSRMWASFSSVLTKINYDPTKLIGGTTRTNQDREYNQLTGDIRIGLDPSPNTALYLRGAFNDVDYALDPPTAINNRDSSGFEFGAGADLRIQQPLHGNVFIGYRQQSYKPPLKDISGFVYNADLVWEATRLSQIRLFAASTIEQPIFVNSSGVVEQTIGLGLRHMLLPNIRAGLQGSFVHDDFRGAGRTDNGWDLDLRLDYLMSRRFGFGFGYRYQRRNSSDPLFDFSRNIFFAELRADF